MTGHVQARGKNSWRIKFDLGRDPITNKRLTRYHTFRGSKKAAYAERTRLLNDVNTGAYVDPDKATVGEFLDRWLRDWAALNVGDKTLEGYTLHAEARIKPHIGQMPIQKLRPVNLQELYAKLRREGRRDGKGGLAGRTVGHVHRMLYQALGHAMLWNVVQTNVATAVEPPKVTTQEVEILREAEVREVLQKLKGRSLYPIVALDVTTGLRRGELLALRWKEVLWDTAQIRVVRAVEQTKKHGIRIKDTKTKYGRRTLAVPPWIVAELRAHWKAQQEARLKLGLGKDDDALVFGLEDGSIRSPNATTKDWVRTTVALGLPRVDFHALRHTMRRS